MQSKITIDAPREKVWSTLWEDATYREWTSVFAEGSWAKTDWKKGSKALFLGTEDSGMVSVIADNKPNEFMSIKHLGTVKDGVEDVDSPEARAWSGCLENYTLQTVNGKRELTVDMTTKGIPQDMLDYFAATWPKALDKVKEVAERN